MAQLATTLRELDLLCQKARGRPFKVDRQEEAELMAAVIVYGQDRVVRGFRQFLAAAPGKRIHYFIADFEKDWLPPQRPRAPQGPLPLEGLERSSPEDLAELGVTR